MATTGFRYKLLTENPDICKAVDDILLDFAGEDNPRRACNYGLTKRASKPCRMLPTKLCPTPTPGS